MGTYVMPWHYYTHVASYAEGNGVSTTIFGARKVIITENIKNYYALLPPFLSSDSVAPTFFAEDAHFALVSHSVQPALVCVCAGFRKSLVLEDSLNTFWQLAKKFH